VKVSHSHLLWTEHVLPATPQEGRTLNLFAVVLIALAPAAMIGASYGFK
jgi:hypothetical protein